MSSRQSIGYAICLTLTIMLVILHFASSAYSYKYAKDRDRVYHNTVSQSYLKEIKQQISFVIIAAATSLFISVALIIGLFQPFSPKIRHILAALNLVLECALASITGLRVLNSYNLRQNLYNQTQFLNFRYFYWITFSDTALNFILNIAYLIVVFHGTMHEVMQLKVVSPVVLEVPPVSNRQL